MSGSLIQPPHGGGAVVARGPAQAYRSINSWPTPESMGWVGEGCDPEAALCSPGAYASVADMILTVLPEDSVRDYDQATLRRWLRIGAARINEYLGNRGWDVPLSQWSETVVWANCEIAYCGAHRKRHSPQGDDLKALEAREAAVKSWCESARDRTITPDARPAAANEGRQAWRYIGPASRGWGG